MHRLLRIIYWVIGITAGLTLVLWLALRHPMPPTTSGPDADALAQALGRAVDADAWARTGAIRWTVQGRTHLWDRQRGLDRIDWSGHRVLLDAKTQQGRAFTDGVEVTDADARDKLLKKAYFLFCNDTFWLNPVVKAFDPGTSRARGTVDGKPALLVSYASGGVTPGDKYLWIVGADGRPDRWRIWVHILPIPGLQFTWEGWTRLPTGAWIATEHRAAGLMAVRLHDIAAAATLRELEPNDPFAGLK